MSRSGSQGARKDIALLRKLKAAKDPNFAPSSLFNDGSELLDKAKQIKGFLSAQKQRTGKANAKTEWILAHQQLQEERDAAEKELNGVLSQLQGSTSCLGPQQQAEATDLLAQWQAIDEESRSLRTELRSQIQGMSQVHKSLKSYGINQFSVEASSLKKEMKVLQQDLQYQLEQLASEAAAAGAEVRSCWPSALASATTDDELMSMLPPRPSAAALAAAPASRATPRFAAAAAAAPGSAGSSRSASAKRRSSSGLGASDPGAAVPADGQRWSDSGDAVEGHSTQGAGAGAAVAGGSNRDFEELEDLLRRYPLASEDVKGRITDVFVALRERTVERLETWRAEAAVSGALAVSATGGWPSDEHSLFLTLRERYWKQLAPKGKGGREAVMTKVAALMPGRTLAELLHHDDWIMAHRMLQRRRKDILDGWSRERRQFLEDSACMLQESADLMAAQAAVAADRLAHELARDRVRDELEAMRAVKEADAQERAAAEAVRAEAEAVARAAAEAAQREEQRRKKELIAAYRAELERRQAAEAAAAAAAAEEEAALMAQQNVYNRERTEWRHAEYLWKQDKVQERRDAEAAEDAAREERLARLRALVAPQVEADPLRVLLPTLASMAIDEEAAEAAAGRAFRAVHGYTQEQVYHDQRFKIMEALQRAGLHTTDYGRQVIAAASTATRTRPDNMTSDQLMKR